MKETLYVTSKDSSTYRDIRIFSYGTQLQKLFNGILVQWILNSIMLIKFNKVRGNLWNQWNLI